MHTATSKTGSDPLMDRAHRSGRFAQSVIGMLLAGCALAANVCAQLPAPLPQPNVPLYLNGSVDATALQADGRVVVVGAFTSVNGTARANIARLQADGSLDTTWNPVANGRVRAVAVDAAGAILIGGDFTIAGGLSRAHIAKLAATGTGSADATWNPNANGSVLAIVVAAGAVYAGGDFTTIGAQARSRIAKLAGGGSGSADAIWDPAANATVAALAAGTGNTLYAAGEFTVIGAQPRGHLAKLTAGGSGAVDSTWNPDADAAVKCLLVDNSGALIVGGVFSSIGGSDRAALAKLEPSGSGASDPSWQADANGAVGSLALDAQGRLYIGGDFIHIGGESIRFLARVQDSDGSVIDPAWQAVPNSSVNALLATSQNTMLVGGDFTRIGEQVRLALASVSIVDASSGLPIDAETHGLAYAVAVESDGSAIIGGNFQKAGSLPRANILRLRSDGSLDGQWDASANSYVLSLAAAPDGGMYVGGYFTLIGGEVRGSLARLAANGTADGWDPGANDIVRALATDSAGNVYAGGRFTVVGGQPRGHIARINAAGIIDPNWHPMADNDITALLPDGSGNVFAGGEFTSVDGTPRGYLVKLSAGSGAVDPLWNPSANNAVAALAAGAPGVLYAGGLFTTVGGLARNQLAKLLGTAAGAVDATWNPAANGPVQTLAVDSDGSIFAGGGFSLLAAQPRNSIAKLSPNGAGLADSTWHPDADGKVIAIALTSNHAVVAGGEFSTIGATQRLGLAELPNIVSQIASTTTMITGVMPAQSVTGQAYVVSFSVAATASTPSGSVSVLDNVAGTCGPVTLVGGSGSCTLETTSAGSRTLTARYTPASVAAYYASSADTGHVVQRADTRVTITAHTPDPSTPMQAVTLGAVLAVNSPGAGDPSGPITIGDGINSCFIEQESSTCSVALSTRGLRTLTATYAGDANFNAATATTSHHVNQLPVAGPASYTGREDITLTFSAAQGVLANDSDPDGDALVVANPGSLTPAGIGGSVQLAADGSFTYVPPVDGNGVATFPYTLSDGHETVTASATIAVAAVNDPPRFSIASSPTLPAGSSGAQTRDGFASVTAYGPPDEANQHVLAWIVRPLADPQGIASDVSIALDGTLHFTLSGAAGSASFGVRLQDNGGTADGGNDTSPEQVFTITVAAGADLSITIDDGVSFVSGGQRLRYTIIARNAGPNAVTAARVRDVVPANLSNVAWTCLASAGAACAPAGMGGIDDTVAMPVGSSVTYALDATVVGIPEFAIQQSVSVTAPNDVPDSNSANNEASDVDTVGLFADGFD